MDDLGRSETGTESDSSLRSDGIPRAKGPVPVVIKSRKEKVKNAFPTVHACKKTSANFCVFYIFGICFVPLAVFLVCAIFAALLWEIECAEVKFEYGDEHELEAPGMCSYYEWWKYIVGNLVGVEGLTDVGPESDHVVAELVDLLIAVWSLTVAGLIIGLVGSLAWTESLARGTERTLNGGFHKLMGFDQAAKHALEAHGGIEFEEYVRIVREQKMLDDMTDAELREIFNECDLDHNDMIKEEEFKNAMEKTHDAMKISQRNHAASMRRHSLSRGLIRKESMTYRFNPAEVKELNLRVELLQAKLQIVLEAVEAVKMRSSEGSSLHAISQSPRDLIEDLKTIEPIV